MARYSSGPPGRAERLRAALTTWGVAGLVAVLVGMIVSFVVVPLLGVQRTGIVAINAGLGGSYNDSGPIVSDQTGISSHSPVKLMVDAVVLLVIALAASRIGRGAVGDVICGVTAVTRDGAPAGRLRIFLNAALPIGLWEVLRFPLGTWSAVLVVVALWAPAMVRTDRRSVFSMATGTHYLAKNVEPDARRGWLARSGDADSAAAAEPDSGGPTLIG